MADGDQQVYAYRRTALGSVSHTGSEPDRVSVRRSWLDDHDGSDVGTHAKNVNLLCEKEELLLGVLRALVSTIDAKDALHRGHSDRVARFSDKSQNVWGLSSQACEEIYMSGLLHDIGKIGVPDAVLGKPERLTDEEFEQIKRHPMIGYEILKALKPFAYLLPGVLHHHESFDGSGYPQKLAVKRYR